MTLSCQDKAALDNVNVATSWRYFHDYGFDDLHSGLRGFLFVLMDEESIDHLSQAPSRDDMARMPGIERARVSWEYFIKVVDTEPGCDGDGEYVDGVSEDP
ncbi:uncharacterized protein PgNI_06749 [Pyricularia grisea]|uniref:Uncharacterized protein n=1 Tax=Pyricularia grisea TaxID=148305 RepID=A0A6P8B111_PYRGI|nr:uncharacterized protein PgNI_06749 [Pyricularia grisea]TLD08585.1 hypothetical protein PgNI_06749 [Pyricularia grisea]